MTTGGVVLYNTDHREDTAPGTGLHESEGPKTPLLTSCLTDQIARAHGGPYDTPLDINLMQTFLTVTGKWK